VLAGPERSDQVAVLCSQLPTLRRLYRGPVSAVAAARAGAPVSEYLAELRIGVVSGPAAGAQNGDDRSGAHEPTTIGGDPVYLPGRYVCPRGVCTRGDYRTTESGLPGCDVFDLPLRFLEER
jgi:hypothetical protein